MDGWHVGVDETHVDVRPKGSKLVRDVEVECYCTDMAASVLRWVNYDHLCNIITSCCSCIVDTVVVDVEVSVGGIVERDPLIRIIS